MKEEYIKNKRLNRLINKFIYKLVNKMGLPEFYDFVSYPGGFVMISRKQSGMKDASAYVKRIATTKARYPYKNNKNMPDYMRLKKEKYEHEYFKIYLIKEYVEKMNDKEFLHTLAHEFSHILFEIKNYDIKEYTCDILAYSFFGYKKPKGCTGGYLYDDIAFKKLFRKKIKSVTRQEP